MMPPFPGLADLTASCDQGLINQRVVELGCPGPTHWASLKDCSARGPSLAPHRMRHHHLLGCVWSVIFRDNSLNAESEVKQ